MQSAPGNSRSHAFAAQIPEIQPQVHTIPFNIDKIPIDKTVVPSHQREGPISIGFGDQEEIVKQLTQ